MSSAGLDSSSNRFFEGVISGKLEETLSHHSLKDKMNLAALDQFIFASPEATPERLLYIQSTIKKIYPEEQKIVRHIYDLAGRRLLQLDPKRLTPENMKIFLAPLQGHPHIVSALLKSIDLESMINQLESDGDKKWFVQWIRTDMQFKAKASDGSAKYILGELMGINPDFVRDYLPDLLIRMEAETMYRVMSFEEKMTFAENCVRISPEVIANAMLSLFTLKERSEKLPELTTIVDKLIPIFQGKLSALSNTPDWRVTIKLGMTIDFLQGIKAGNYSVSNSKTTHHEKDSHHWDCLGETFPGSGLYTYQLKQEYEKGAMFAAGENALIFPAVEPIFDQYGQTIGFEGISDSPELTLLGFGYESTPDGTRFTVPDGKTLDKKWEELRKLENYKDLPLFSCGESIGIASAEEFMDLLDQHDVVISKDSEHAHDGGVHALPSVVAIFMNPTEYHANQRFMRSVRAYANKILAHYKLAPATPEDETVNKDHAAAALINEMIAIYYDLVTSQPGYVLIAALRRGWVDGTVFETLNSGSVFGWLPALWKNEAVRGHLKTLGVRSPYAEFPAEILQQHWLKFKAAYIAERRASTHTPEERQAYIEEMQNSPLIDQEDLIHWSL